MQSIVALAALLPLVAAHGFVQDPPARQPGDAYKAACGDQPFYQQSSDINGNVQGIMQVVGSDFDASKCNLWLCKGFLLADSPDSVQTYTAGQVVDFTVNIAAPHTGIANVSVVDTATNTIIGEPLIEFENYAANAGVAANNSAFSVTIPSDLGSSCTTAGDCVLQWFWDAEGINQTYESCIDFTVGGSSSGGSSGSASSAVASSVVATEAAATTAVAATSAAAAATTEPAAVVTSAITPVAPGSTDAAAVTSAAPAATSAVADDEECPADEADDEGDVDEGDDEDCDLDEDDDEYAGDDEDCDLDGEETDVETVVATATDVAAVAISSTSTSAAVTTTAAAQNGSGSGTNYGSGSNNGAGSGTKPAVTSYITVSAKPLTHTQVQTKYVTVTAEAAACT